MLDKAVEAIVGVKVDSITHNTNLSIARWAVDTDKWGLLLCGNYGSGKTTHAQSFARLFSLLEGGEYRPNIAIISALDVCYLARLNEDKFNELCDKTELIVLDDVGVEPLTVNVFGTQTSPITYLLYKRYDLRLPIFITTNLGVSKFYERYGERIKDRAREMFSILTMKNESRR